MGILNALEEAATGSVGAVVDGAKDLLGLKKEEQPEVGASLGGDDLAALDSKDSAIVNEVAEQTPPESIQTYTVQAGDSLSKISREFYGNSHDYMKIFEANRDKLSNPDNIEIGQELVIPKA